MHKKNIYYNNQYLRIHMQNFLTCKSSSRSDSSRTRFQEPASLIQFDKNTASSRSAMELKSSLASCRVQGPFRGALQCNGHAAAPLVRRAISHPIKNLIGSEISDRSF